MYDERNTACAPKRQSQVLEQLEQLEKSQVALSAVIDQLSEKISGVLNPMNLEKHPPGIEANQPGAPLAEHIRTFVHKSDRLLRQVNDLISRIEL